MTTKQCTACGKTLPLTDFYVDNSREGGLSIKCRDCAKAYNKAWRDSKKSGVSLPQKEKKTADMKEYQRIYRMNNPEKFTRTPEQEREKYVRLMKRLHGEGWQPAPKGPKLTDEEKAARRKERNKKKRSSIKARPDALAKHKTRRATSKAISSGRLVRQPCEVCGALEVEAHHDDYSKPLDVRWLCPEHHRAHHAATT